MRIRLSLSLVLFFILPSLLLAQKKSARQIAGRYLQDQFTSWELTESDVREARLVNEYRTRHNGVTHLFYAQQAAGVTVYNALIGIHITREGRVGYATSTFIPDAAAKINITSFSISAQEAVSRAADHLQLPLKEPLRILKTEGKTEILFSKGGIARRPIRAQLQYYPTQDGQLRLSWNLSIDQLTSADYWNLQVDAVSGDLLAQNNYTVYCQNDDHDASAHSSFCRESAVPSQPAWSFSPDSSPVDASSYRVFPFPVESPAHGERVLLTDPADPEASPFGWHDVNGKPGAEYTITRGNNVHAFLDLNDSDVSNNDEPDGGASLRFDFPFDPNLEPSGYREASVTQLFYLNNFMHDFAYHYGFDEAAGNFQQNNYNRGGRGGDAVNAHAQDGGDINNANFTTPPEGDAPRMQMYLWSQSGNKLLQLTSPAAIAGRYEVGTAVFGPSVDSVSARGLLVQALDDSFDPTLACQPLINSEALRGNIALIDRGSCTFEEKVKKAEAAGATGVIICNYEDQLTNMADVSTVPDPGIPAVLIRSSDCERIRDFLGEGVEVLLQEEYGDGPKQLDGDFDNGIVAHEYAHGISMRLTGNANTTTCLFNDEQMGEGWSDFFTLVTTYQQNADGSLPRGIGNYVLRKDLASAGVRDTPYSTDFSVNALTYDDIVGTTSPHDLGEIWASTLWDLYWAFVDAYGWDDDLIYGTGGNNMAIQLIIDAMKIQECEPGFVKARDAIIAADIINNNGANECLIWDVFARRGIGWSADEGSPWERNDGVEAYDSRPECSKQLRLVKQTTELIEAGDVFTCTLTLTNYKSTSVSGVSITDELPEGTELVPGSSIAPVPLRQAGQQIIFDVGEMESGAVVKISYKISTSPELRSARQFFDDMEQDGQRWLPKAINGFGTWEISDSSAFSGNHAWFVPNLVQANDQVLQNFEPVRIAGNQPVLRFYHQYDTEPGTDGGILEVSDDGGATWQTIPREKIFRNSYRGRMAFQTFSTAELYGYTGNNKNFEAVYADLSEFQGKEIYFRFHFRSLGNSALDTLTGTGWFIDDIEIMDMYNYQSLACVSTDQGDFVCAEAPGRGTVVETGELTSAGQPQKAPWGIRVYPVPARDWVNVAVQSPYPAEASIQLLSMEGRLLRQVTFNLGGDEQIIPIETGQLPPGFYLVRIQSKAVTAVKKVIIE